MTSLMEEFYMDLRNALQLDPNAIGLLHERRHGLNRYFPERNWGWSASDTGNLPGAWPNNYRRFQAHDEPDAYLDTLDRLFKNIARRLKRRDLDPNEINSELMFAFALMISGIETSNRNISIAQYALPVAERGEVKFERMGYRFAAGLKVGEPAEEFEVFLPVPGSVGENDPMNYELLLDRVDGLERVSRNILTQLTLIQHVWEIVKAQQSRMGRLIAVEALLGSLERSAYYDPGFNLIELNELAATYNELVNRHYFRHYGRENQSLQN